RINDPQENSPVVSAPTTRSGGGSRVFMSATWTITSFLRKVRTWRSNPETWTEETFVAFCANDWPPQPKHPARSTTSTRAVLKCGLRMESFRALGNVVFSARRENVDHLRIACPNFKGSAETVHSQVSAHHVDNLVVGMTVHRSSPAFHHLVLREE